MFSEIFSSGFYMLITILIFALAIDLVIAELPTAIHPVVFIGKFIDFFKNKLIKFDNKFSGVLLAFSVIILSSICVLIPLLISKYLIIYNDMLIYLFKLIAVVLLSSSFSVKLLLDSSKNIEKDLKDNNLKKARKAMSYLVSRNTDSLSKEHIISASIETLTENITDSYISTVFYYSIIGIIAVFMGFNDYLVIILAILAAFIHRTINTLDAMVGYKNNELKNIGWFSANLDDILNFIPARIAGIIVVIAAFVLRLNWRNSFFIMRRDAKVCDSPNSGFTMAAVAGALNIQLEKKDNYIIGDFMSKLNVDHITQAIDLSRFTIALATLFFVFLLLDFYILFL